MTGRGIFLRAGLSRGALLIGVVATVTSFGASRAAAVPNVYPPPVVGLQLSTSLASPGQTIQVTGEGCAAGSTVTISLKKRPPKSESVQIGMATADAQGTFTTSVTIPLNTDFGRHDVLSACPSGINPGQTLNMSARLTVVPSQAAKGGTLANLTSANDPSRSFAHWGTRAPLLASLAGILLASTAVLVARNRRRRRHA